MTEAWGHAQSEQAERWDGAAATREEAIAEGREAYPGEAFWIASGTLCSPESFMPSADFIIEQAAESAADEIGEAAEDWPPEVSSESKAELEAFLAEWSKKHLPCSGFWIADGSTERIEASPLPGEGPVKP